MYLGPESESHGNITASTWKSLDAGREGSRLRSLLQQIQAALCPANHSKESADILYILSLTCDCVMCVYLCESLYLCVVCLHVCYVCIYMRVPVCEYVCL